MRLHAWNHYKHAFHAVSLKETYDSEHGNLCNHVVPSIEKYEMGSKHSKLSNFHTCSKLDKLAV